MYTVITFRLTIANTARAAESLAGAGTLGAKVALFAIVAISLCTPVATTINALAFTGTGAATKADSLTLSHAWAGQTTWPIIAICTLIAGSASIISSGTGTLGFAVSYGAITMAVTGIGRALGFTSAILVFILIITLTLTINLAGSAIYIAFGTGRAAMLGNFTSWHTSAVIVSVLITSGAGSTRAVGI